MKLAKVLPAMAALVVLSAYAKRCTKNGKQSGTNGNPTVTDKTVVYTCNKKTVTAVYQFRKPRANSSNGDGG